MVILCFLVSFLVILLKLVNVLISEYSSSNREELSAFECGFDTHRLSRVPFSLRYFFLTLVFLLFDLEVILLVFSPSLLLSSRVVFMFLVISSFLVILVLSLFYELRDGTLD